MFYQMLIYRPSLLSPNRPNSAAAALPMGPGQIDYENGPGRLSILVYYLISRHRGGYDLSNLTPRVSVWFINREIFGQEVW